ncbi:AraC family transcriptional regulator [Galbibacter marinus]|uniref:AraC family transcriptional regulator n=1 Tax=Galbibacter marinus TaxID=555500 RepID=K2P5W9_9FLAO|nr:helix-turn-helix domain-containing protein [Galbibacter marinus]EKF56388.1 AraC family transcriptional regulator [Galbibacter marinus]
MLKIALLIPEAAVSAAVTSTRYVFNTVNKFLVGSGKAPFFDIQLVGCKEHVPLQDGITFIKTDIDIDEPIDVDLVIIPPLYGDLKAAIEINKRTTPWIKKQRDKGAEIATLCVGAFLLAETGLLNGKKCSTHWAYYSEFKSTYPKVELVDGAVITEDDGIYSSGGAVSLWNLLIYLVEKYTNREMAIMTAKYFSIDIDRNSQNAFMIFKGQKNHQDKEVKKAQLFIEKNYHKKITVDELASMVAISRRSFERRFKQATDNTVLEYLQRVKVEAAKRSFENSRDNISEVMYDVGYMDTKAFRNIFRKYTGLTPVQYRYKYNRRYTA